MEDEGKFGMTHSKGVNKMKKAGFSRFLLFVLAAQGGMVSAQTGGVGTWSAQANLPQWNKALGVTRTRQSCAESETPDKCLQFVGSVAKANNVKVFLNIALDTSTSIDYSAAYSRMSVTAPYLVEIGIDDFVDQYSALFPKTPGPAALLSTVIANVKSANPNLKFGATIYEDQLGNAYLQDAKLPAALRGQFDYVHLFPHYREDGPNFAAYVQQAKRLFPNAGIIAGSYAYDRRYYLPCAPQGQPCTTQQDFDLFQQTLALQVQLMRSGAVDSIEFYPGFFGAEEKWDGWSNPRECDPSDLAACIANTKTMRQAAVALLGGSSTVQAWTQLTPGGRAPVPRSGHSAVMDSASHRMIVFGGTSDNGDLNDTWILTNANGQGGAPAWIPLTTPSAPPAAYYSAGMYDAGSNRMILFGGAGGTDVWVLTNANGLGGGSSWIQLAPTGNPPFLFTNSQKEVYDSASNMMIVYDSGNSVWTLSNANGLGGNPVWTQLNVSNDGPSIRNGFTAVYNPAGSRMIVFGGSDGTTDFNEVWLLANANGLNGAPTWTNILPQGAAGAPAGRSGHTAVYDPARDTMTIFGGIGQPSDTWMLSSASGIGGTPVWAPVNSGDDGPAARADWTAVLDTSSSNMVVFGGYNTDFLNDAWSLTGTPLTWWPDPATHRGLSTWVNFSSDYDTLWSNRQLADQEINSLQQQGVEVVFLSISSASARPHLQALANRTDPVTGNVQYLLNALASHQIRACASILSDNFTGSASQVQRFDLVDPLLAFNASLGASDTGFTCVATDLEMPAGSRSTAVYDLWKQFHANLRDRIAARGGSLKLLAWMQGPDFLLTQMSPADRSQLMRRESISVDAADATQYDGALRYLTTQNGKLIFDAVIPMWYFTPADPYYRYLNHNLRELQAMRVPGLYLIAGLMVQNAGGTCCPGCVSGSQDYKARLQYNDTLRQKYPNLIGTGVFMWPIRGAWSCQ